MQSTPVAIMAASINQLADEISENAIQKGFWDITEDPLMQIPLKLVLIHDEVSEALQVHRKFYEDDATSDYTTLTPEQEEDFKEELADIIIRTLDVAGNYGFDDFGQVVIRKHEKNLTRPTRHGKRY